MSSSRVKLPMSPCFVRPTIAATDQTALVSCIHADPKSIAHRQLYRSQVLYCYVSYTNSSSYLTYVAKSTVTYST